jgi:hypothetical protein
MTNEDAPKRATCKKVVEVCTVIMQAAYNHRRWTRALGANPKPVMLDAFGGGALGPELDLAPDHLFFQLGQSDGKKT